MFKPTTIRTRLLAGFVLVAVLPVIAVSIGSLTVAYYTGRRQVGGRLESVAALKQSDIKHWIHSLEEDLVVASNTDCAFERISVVLTFSQEHKHYDFYNRAVRKRLQGIVGQSSNLEGVFLADLEGKVALSTTMDEEGWDFAHQPFFQRGLAAPYVQIPFPDRLTSLSDEAWSSDEVSVGPSQRCCAESVIIAMPVLGQQGRPLGIIAAQAPLEALKDILGERTGLGETGKAYLVNETGVILAKGRFPPPTADGFPAHAPGIGETLGNQMSATGLYRDYRGVVVLGAYRRFPEWGIVLVTEQDLSEGLYAIRDIIAINLAVGAGAVCLASALALFVTRTIAAPLANLAETATDIADGNLDRRANTARHDEIGILAQAFNSMTAQLQDLINNLEERVTERTRALRKANETLERRAVQLETSAQVSRELTSILDIDDLLTQVVELIRDAFHYYHVHVFLLTEDGSRLTLRASTSQTVPEHHHIGVDESSINSKAIRSRQAILVNNVKADTCYLADQYLPDIESELVAPLRLGDALIGTLDVQSVEVDAFTEQDLLVIQSLGDQIAVAIENAQLYDRSQELAVLEERTRLARELHDSVTQSMYSVVLLTEGWRRSIRNGGEAHIDEYLTRIGEINQQGLKEMRLLIHELRPPVLEEEGLLGALHQRLDAVEKRAGISARLLTDEIVELPHAIEEGLYRIAQEALNNALKHAQANNVVVRISTRNEQIVLEVEDDGQGFDVGAVDVDGGMGLANMRHRAGELGGSIEIRSQPGSGALIRVRIAR